MKNRQYLVVIFTTMAFGLSMGTISPALAAEHHHDTILPQFISTEGCGYDDPNPDSFEVDQLCQELGDDPECFDEHGNLSHNCAERLEAQGSKEYERYKEYLEYEEKEEHEEYEGHDNHEYGKNGDTSGELTGVMQQHVSFPRDASYYGDIEFNVNGYTDTYDAKEWLNKYDTSELIFPYEYYGYKPETTKACITNLDSLKEVCQTVETGTDDIYFVMPD